VTTAAARPLAFARRRDRRMVAGVAGGFADAHGVDPVVVRAALVVATVAGGLGLVVYAVGFAWATEPAAGEPVAGRAVDPRRTVAVACVLAGGVMLMRAAGLWPGDPLVLAAGIVAAGLAALGVFGSGASVPDRGGGRALVERRLPGVTAGRYARLRITGGALVLAVGLVVAGAHQGVSSGVRLGILATALTVVGVALVLGPWIARTAQEVAEERRERIRSQERAAMAAHLHDSVLQTLALIQRSAGDPRRTVTLARRQERELRAWLYGGDTTSATLAAAVRAMVEDVESTYDVTVDAVVVGDRSYDERAGAVVAALREACVNAAKHSGVHEVSVFVEVTTGAVDAFVRDRGRGFVRADVAPDRRGISESIEGRIVRLGGTVEIDSAPGSGTEVHLRLPGEAGS
jgi:signal transduction histidine kinase/phage shock protein PspC (stress-responsive transcriptional regulator)